MGSLILLRVKEEALSSIPRIPMKLSQLFSVIYYLFKQSFKMQARTTLKLFCGL